MNVLDLKFPDDSFDVAIDKGTMDALMVEVKDVWNPPETVVQNVLLELSEVYRVLKPGGRFVYITFGQPHFRRRYLERFSWHLKIDTIGDGFQYFVYIMTKPLYAPTKE